MKRREALSACAAAAGAQLVGTSLASCGAQQEAETPAAQATAGGSAAGPRTLVTNWAVAAAECERVGEICLEHCIRLLADGNTAMGECAKSVHEMLAICRAVGPIAAGGSAHAPALAALCKATCETCFAACAAHRAHHAACAACADACEATIAAAHAVASA